MVIMPSLQTIFIHIPRTGGTSLSHALMRACPDAIYRQHTEHHVTANEARKEFPGYRLFSIMRNPWDIFRSHYGFVLRHAENPQPGWQPWFRKALLESAEKTFAEHVQHCLEHDILCSSGGFYQHYLDDDTMVFQFHETPYHGIATMLKFPLIAYRENESIHIMPDWDEKQRERVGTHCHGDIERFGYKFNGIGP